VIYSGHEILPKPTSDDAIAQASAGVGNSAPDAGLSLPSDGTGFPKTGWFFNVRGRL